jgi:hypothetical protein
VHSARAACSPVAALRACVMMACNGRAKACSVTVRVQRLSALPSPDRRSHPNSDDMASLLGDADSGHSAGMAAHGRILVTDTHINFPIERTTERSWR